MKQRKGLITVIIIIVVVILLFLAYNMFRFPARFRSLSDESLSESEVDTLREEITAREEKKVLVAYFSYSGTTQGVAEALSSRIGGDLFEISPRDGYSNVYLQSNSEIRRGERPELSDTVANMDEYDIVFVGYPVWFHATPASVNTFLESYDLTGKLIIPFCTSGGSDIDETMPTFLDSCRDLAVYGERRISGTSQIDEWIAELDLNLPSGSETSSADLSSADLSSAKPDIRGRAYEYDTQELSVDREGNQIYGVIYVPRDAGGQMPAVIFSHGFGGRYTTGAPYAEALAERGYVVYCFDFCGGAPGSLSSGSTLEMSVFTEQADLEAVMEMIRGLDYVNSQELFLIGTSQGGAVSAITGAKHEDQVRGMVLLYPAFILAERANELFQSADEMPDTYYFMWMDVGRAYFEPLIGYDIYADAAGYEKDVLLLHGDQDSIVPLSYSERALEMYPSAELKVIRGAGHGFYGTDEQLAVDYILEYLDAHQI